MRYIIFILLLIGSIGANAQFPNTDSLRKFNNKYVGNSPINSFTNLRLNTLLYGMINHIDSARLGTTGSVGVDTLYALNDSTIRYKKNGVFYNAPLPSYARVVNDTTIIINGDTVKVGGSGGSTVSAAAPIEKTVDDTLRLTYNTEGLRIKDDAIDAKAKVFDSEASLRALTGADTSSIYRVRINRDYGEFKYDPDDTTSADDSAMVLVDASGNRFKRVINDVIYPEDFGAKGDGTTDDAAAFNKMMQWMGATGTSRGFTIKFKSRKYKVESPIIFPNTINAGASHDFIKIDGYGTQIFTTSAISLLYRQPTETGAPLSDYKLIIEGLQLKGSSLTGQKGLEYGPNYGGVIRDMEFQSFDTAIVARFWLKCEINNVFFTSIKSVGILGSHYEGVITGMTVANSAFNANLITNCRFFQGNGSYASVMMLGADGNIVRDCVSEGFKPRYNFYFDYQGSTASNVNTFENIWIETSQSGVQNTLFYLRYAGQMVIRNIQRELQDTLFEIPSTIGSGSSLIIEKWPNMGNLPARPFNASGSTLTGSSIRFQDMPYGVMNTIMDSTKWASGIIPTNTSVEGYLSSNGGRVYRSQGLIKLEPNYNAAANSKTLEVASNIKFPDNLYTIGTENGVSSRPKGIRVGTDGIRVDPTATYGIGFVANSTVPKIYWKYVNDSLSQIVGTGALQMPQGTTDQRTLSGVSGSFRLNTTLLRPEITYSNQWKQLLTNDDTVSINSRIVKNTDSLVQHNLRIIKNQDSISSHNIRILANVDTLFSHNLRILKNNDSLFSHNNRILLVNDTLYSHNNRLIALENTTGGGGTSSELLVKPGDADYTITTSTENVSIVYFTAITADRTVTLPDPATNTGRKFSIKHGGSGLFNILFSANIYENSTTFITSLGVGQSIQFMSDGTQYIITR